MATVGHNTKRTGAEVLADMLAGYGVTHVFMVPAVLRRTFAEMERRTKIARVHCHGEKSAAYMADGYARASGKPGICMAQVIGALNLAAGLRDAWLAHSPVIAFTGGRDPKTDLALITIETKQPLKPLPLGDSEMLEVGDWVIAIGNPFGLGNTVTAGIVSAKYRQLGAGAYDNFIQTDASINPGNSGGPLLNTAGEVIGINSAIFSQSGGNIGIGFAIPINMAKDLLPQLKEGKVVRGWLGVTIQRITSELKEKLKLKDEKGALVADVTKEGPADKGGIKRGDVIVEFDGKEVKESNDLPYMVASTPVGKSVTVEVIRKGQKERLDVKIGELAEEKEAEVVSEVKSDLGMTVEALTPELAEKLGQSETAGLVVVQVDDDTPAAEAGVRPGDIILEVDQTPMKGLSQFEQKIKSYKAGDTILFLIRRGSAALYLTLKVLK